MLISLIFTIKKKSSLKFQSISVIISFYENHDKISKIKSNNITPKEFSFKEVTSNEAKKIIKSLNRQKVAISSCIPVSILIDLVDLYLLLLTDIIDCFLKRSIFPDELVIRSDTFIQKS